MVPTSQFTIYDLDASAPSGAGYAERMRSISISARKRAKIPIVHRTKLPTAVRQFGQNA